MEYPAVDSLMESVRKINEIARRARSGDIAVEDYLRSVSSDPVTEWFTDLLREKNQELKKEQDRAAQLAAALRTWRRSKLEDSSESEADLQLVKTLRTMSIVED